MCVCDWQLVKNPENWENRNLEISQKSFDALRKFDKLPPQPVANNKRGDGNVARIITQANINCGAVADPKQMLILSIYFLKTSYLFMYLFLMSLTDLLYLASFFCVPANIKHDALDFPPMSFVLQKYCTLRMFLAI